MSFVLATWNISECVCANWDVNKGIELNPSYNEILRNCNEIVALINRYNIDIICFQEMPITINGKDIIVKKIIEETELSHYYGIDTYPTFLVKNGNAGIAVFSRYEFFSTRFSFLKNPGISKTSQTGKKYYSFNKGIITAEIVLGKDILTIVTGHGFSFSPFDAVAEDYPESFREIATCAIGALSSQENVVVAGDFNSEKLFDILPELNGCFMDKLRGPTTVSGVMEGENFANGRKLDYFLTSKNVSTKIMKKISNFSDHYLCIGVCAIRE